MYVCNHFGPQNRLKFVYFLFVDSVLTNNIFKVEFNYRLKLFVPVHIYKTVLWKYLEKGR